MTQRAIAVIVLGEESEFTWRTSDPDGELQRLLSGSVTIREGKEASTLSWTVPDPSLEVANSIPLPQKRKNRVPVECWFGFAPKLEKVFTGHLVTVRATGLPGRLELSAVDKSKKGRRTPRTRNLTSTNAAGLLGSLAEDMGFILDLSEAPEFAESTEFAEVFQHGETNWELAQRIVESVGYRAMPRGSHNLHPAQRLDRRKTRPRRGRLRAKRRQRIQLRHRRAHTPHDAEYLRRRRWTCL